MGSPTPLLGSNGSSNGGGQYPHLHHPPPHRSSSPGVGYGGARRFFGARRIVLAACVLVVVLFGVASFASPSSAAAARRVLPSRIRPLPASASGKGGLGAVRKYPPPTGSGRYDASVDDEWGEETSRWGGTNWKKPLGDTVGWLGGKLSSSLGGGTKPREPSYRERLEATTSPPYFDSSSPTLSFSHIYVLSLPSRQDRRDRMEKLAAALGLKFTFVDALSKDQGVIRWIAERVEEVRNKKRPLLAKLLEKPADKVGGLKPGCDWLIRGDGERGNTSFAPSPEASPELPEYTFPSLKEAKYGNKDWVSYLVSHGPDGLDAKEGADFDVAERLHDPNERILQRQLSAGSVAVWYGQTGVMRKMLENGDETALVLEDDVDIEWDIGRLWANIHRRLPKGDDGWQIAFMGHCWGRESTRPQYNHPLLHQSAQPRCLHGYAYTRKGAQRILKLLSDPWIAYQTAVDIAVPTFISDGLLGDNGAFSVDPQIIVQSKELASDITKGIGSPWRGLLMDSTWDRILKEEGVDVPEPVYLGAVKGADPATLFRGAKLEGEVDLEELHAEMMKEAAAQRKVDQDKARQDAFNREVLVEGVNAPKKVPTKKLPGPAVGEAGAKAAAAVADRKAPRPVPFGKHQGAGNRAGNWKH